MNAGVPQPYRARYVFPVEGPPVRDGMVVVRNGTIVEVATHTDLPIEDLGNVAVIPGLVNAHTHLEFSSLEKPLSAEGAFADWIRRVVAYRREFATPERISQAVRKGLDETKDAGVKVLGEIATPGWPQPVLCSCGIQVMVFAELLGLGAASIETNLDLARAHLRNPVELDGLIADWWSGLSPHAPYSVHHELFDRVVEFSAQKHLPVAFHLAETREELEVLSTGTGPLREMLDEFGVWEAGAIKLGARPLDYLERLAAVDHSLVIHGNYLTDEEIAFVAFQRERMTVVYCPRTHEYFGHESHPLDKLLAAGARVALGTDSRASNPDLNLLEEIRAVVRRHPGVSPAQALEMGTRSGAEALGLARLTGTLVPGKLADFTIVNLPDHDARDPHELLM